MKAFHIVFNPVTGDPRVMKELNTLADTPTLSQVFAMGLFEEGFDHSETLPNGVTIYRQALFFRRFGQSLPMKLLKYIELCFRGIRLAKKLKIDVCHCHDLEALPLGFLVSKITGAKLIYDAHELETETPFLRRSLKPMAFALEKRLVRHVDAMICVSTSIKTWYETNQNISPTLLRNVHPTVSIQEPPTSIRQLIKADSSAIIIAFAGFFRPEIVDLIIETAKLTSAPHIHFVFMGKGKKAREIEALANTCSHVSLIPFVKHDELIPMLSTADIGIDFHKIDSLNTLYSLPNKLFSYISAEIPTIVTDGPDKAAIIAQYGCGWVFPEDPKQVADWLKTLKKQDVLDKKIGTKQAKQDLCWEKEKEALLDVYETLA